MAWDLYAQQPCWIEITAQGVKKAVAAVSRVSGGVVWWNADYVISVNMPGGTPGSGFGNYMLDGEPVFDELAQVWTLPGQDGNANGYIFSLPTPEMMRLWEGYKQYVPSVQTLQVMAVKDYP